MMSQVTDLKALSTASSEEGAVLILRNPSNDEPLKNPDGSEMTIRVLGQDSTAYTQLKRKLADGKIDKFTKLGKRAKITSEQLERDELDLLVAATRDWNVTWNGVQLECNEENIRKVYTELPVVREQVSEFIQDRSNFLGNSSKT